MIRSRGEPGTACKLLLPFRAGSDLVFESNPDESIVSAAEVSSCGLQHQPCFCFWRVLSYDHYVHKIPLSESPEHYLHTNAQARDKDKQIIPLSVQTSSPEACSATSDITTLVTAMTLDRLPYAD